MSVRPSICPHGKIHLLMDGFSSNLIFEDFSKVCPEDSVCTFMIISRRILLRMKNVYVTICKKNQNSVCLITFFRKSCPLWGNVEKCGRAREATDENIRIFLFQMARQTLVGQGLCIIEASRSHSDTPHSVGLLWTVYQPDTVISTWQHTTLLRDRHPYPWRYSKPPSQHASGRWPMP
jgi:hypothetical protein